MSAPSQSTDTNTNTDSSVGTDAHTRGRQLTSPPFTSYTDLWDTLERNGVPIVSLETVAGDPYVRISTADSPDPRLVTVLTTVIAARRFPGLITDTYQVQIVSEAGGERIGYCYVSADWIRQYHDGEVTGLEYAWRVLETYQTYDDREQTHRAARTGGDGA